MQDDYIVLLERIAFYKGMIQRRRSGGRPITDLLVDLQHACDDLIEAVNRELSSR